MLFNVKSIVTDEGTLRALVRLPMGQHVFGQVVLPDEGLVAEVAPEVPLPVGGHVLRQRAPLRKAPITDGAGVGQLLCVRSMMNQQF